MTDRIPTQVLENGAIRYAFYDENGIFLRYEYLLPADEPTDEGTLLCMATLLSTATAKMYPPNTETVNDALASVPALIANYQTGYASDLYLFITMQHPIQKMSPYYDPSF